MNGLTDENQARYRLRLPLNPNSVPEPNISNQPRTSPDNPTAWERFFGILHPSAGGSTGEPSSAGPSGSTGVPPAGPSGSTGGPSGYGVASAGPSGSYAGPSGFSAGPSGSTGGSSAAAGPSVGLLPSGSIEGSSNTQGNSYRNCPSMLNRREERS